MSIVFLFAVESITDIFIPSDIRCISIIYVRISGFSILSSALEIAIFVAIRILDKLDILILISSTKFIINIILNIIFISTFYVILVTSIVNSQTSIRLVYNMLSAAIGIVYFVYITTSK